MSREPLTLDDAGLYFWLKNGSIQVLGRALFYCLPPRMHLELLGLSGVKIQTDRATILLSPPHRKSELPASRMKASVAVLEAPEDEINIESASENERLFVISGPGEYESSGVFFYCAGKPPATMLSAEGMTVAHLGSLNRELSAPEVERFEGTDILLVPVGGGDVLNAKAAAKLVAELEPRVVIPMHFAHPKLKTKYDKIESFLKEMGSAAQPVERAKISKKDLPQDTMEIIWIA